MKWGAQLEKSKNPEWAEHYLQYKVLGTSASAPDYKPRLLMISASLCLSVHALQTLKKIISSIAAKSGDNTISGALDGKTQGIVSLSVPTLTAADNDDLPADSGKRYVEEDFFVLLQSEIDKVSAADETVNYESALMQAPTHQSGCACVHCTPAGQQVHPSAGY